jgi:hypothetical protein
MIPFLVGMTACGFPHVGVILSCTVSPPMRLHVAAHRGMYVARASMLVLSIGPGGLQATMGR